MENSDTSLSNNIPSGEQDGDKDMTTEDNEKTDLNYSSKAENQTELPPFSTRSTSQVDLIQEDKTQRTEDNKENAGNKLTFDSANSSQVSVQGKTADDLKPRRESTDEKSHIKSASFVAAYGASAGDSSEGVEGDKEPNTDNVRDADSKRDSKDSDFNSTEQTDMDKSGITSDTKESDPGNKDKVVADSGIEDKPVNKDSDRGPAVLRSDKGHKDEDSDSNVKDTDPLLSKSDSQKTLQSDGGSSVQSDSSSDTKKLIPQNKKKYSYIPIVASGKNSTSNDSKRKKSDTTPPGRLDSKRDKDSKISMKANKGSVSGSAQSIAMKEKSESTTSSDTKGETIPASGETTFSIVNEEENSDKNNKNIKWKESDSINKDKKQAASTKKESKIPELDKKKQNLIQKTLQREKAVLSNGSVKSADKENVENDKTTDQNKVQNNVQNNVQKTETTIVVDSEKKIPLENFPVVETKSDPFKPKSILARAIMKKVKEGSGQGQNNVDPKHVVLNGPPAAVKTPSKKSLTVPSPVPRDSSDERDEKLSIGSRRDSTKLSLSDSMSRKSVDYRVANATAVVIPASGQEEEKPKSLVSNDSWIRSAIPYLPLSMSVFCLILNIFVPGSGTVLSGFAILCCGKARVQTKDDHVPITLCVNVWVGVAQLFTVTFLLVGWFWSMAWGIKMVILSIEYRKELKQKREKELQALALSAFGSPAHGRSIFG